MMVKTVDTAQVTSSDLGRIFLQFCDKLHQPPTQRQWNAFQNKRGRVWDAVEKQAGHDRRLRSRIESESQRVRNEARGVYSPAESF